MSFDAHALGTSAAAWTDGGRLDRQPRLDLGAIGELIVVAAHPDDETLGCGGTIAVCAARGIPIQVLVVTDGAASHPGSPTHTTDELSGIREEELTSALRILAPRARITWLGLPDGASETGTDAIRRTLEEAVGRAAATPLVLAPWVGDGHHDHRIVGEVAESVGRDLDVAVLGYPIWMWHWAAPDDDDVPWSSMLVAPFDELAGARKAKAIGCFRSQIAPLSDDPIDRRVLEPGVLAHFERPLETFIEPAHAATSDAPAMERSYFDDLYSRYDDPWGFRTRWYEQRKRAVTLAALPNERYSSVLEIGCSLGLLTVELAGRADAVLATDISQTALDAARTATADLPNVTLERRDASDGLPEGRFDLVVISEVGYYFTAAGLRALAEEVRGVLADGGDVVLCHWRPEVTDYPLGGDEVHAILTRALGLAVVSRAENTDFLLEVLSADTRSVAERTGLR
ncbi:MAG: PIG-L family deacetylase [Microbacteriaceae bacterium]